MDDHGGKLRSRWALLAVAAGFLALIGATILLSVLFYKYVGEPVEGEHVPAPVPQSSNISIESGELALTRRGEMIPWNTESSRLDAGVFRLVWFDEGSRLELRFRADRPAPTRLAHDASLHLTNTYNVTFDPGNGTVFRDPAAGSYVDFLTQETIDRRVSGKFHLDFGGGLVLDGVWPHDPPRPPYEGILSIAFFGGAAILAAISWWRKRREGAR